MTTLAANRLRHRITIQRPITQQDPETGQLTTNWVAVATNIAAAIEPSSVREFVAAQAMQSQVIARIVIRYRPGLTAQMRILHGSRIYNPQGWLADPDSGIEYLTAPCSEGVNQGQ
jgi:SPP1 family predicted phage head-tail adaptor